MVTKVYSCPHCGQSEGVVRHGFTRWGSQRLRCKACRRAWTPEGKSRTLSDEKRALIENLVGERTSQRAIARALSASRNTVAQVLKKGRAVPAKLLRHAVAGDCWRRLGDGRVGSPLPLQVALPLPVGGSVTPDPSGDWLLHRRSQHPHAACVLEEFASMLAAQVGLHRLL